MDVSIRKSNKIRSRGQFDRTLAFGKFFAGCSSVWGGLATELGRLSLPNPPRGAGAMPITALTLTCRD